MPLVLCYAAVCGLINTGLLNLRAPTSRVLERRRRNEDRTGNLARWMGVLRKRSAASEDEQAALESAEAVD